jgi:hypothetical protein
MLETRELELRVGLSHFYAFLLPGGGEQTQLRWERTTVPLQKKKKNINLHNHMHGSARKGLVLSWVIYMTFWDVLLVCFPMIRENLHSKRRLQQFFVAAGTCWRSVI